MALDATFALPHVGGSRSQALRLIAVALALVVAWTLAAAGVGSPLAASVSAQPATSLPAAVDADQDGWIGTIEDGLGSDAADNASIPESFSIPVSCWDGLDNDRDGVSDDEDPGCQPIPPLTGVFPDAGSDWFESTISLQGYELSTALGVCTVDFEGTGPVVVDRGAPSGGSDSTRAFKTEMVAMQLTGTATLLPGTPCNPGEEPITIEATLIEDPDQVSSGTVSSQSAAGTADYPADSFFDIHFQIATPIGMLAGGAPGGPPGTAVRVTNTVNSMPPYHSPANADLNPDCYAVTRADHVHCPKPPLDHFLCYSGDFPAGGGNDVQLSDQFGQSLSNVGPADRFCNATSKNSLAIFDEGAHLERFAFAADDTGSLPQRVQVSNQFGLQQVLAVGRPVGLFVPSQKGVEVPPAALDHFKCYSVEGDAVGRAITLADQFSGTVIHNGSAGSPRTLCNPTAKVHDGVVTPVADPMWHLVCYDVQTDARADRSVRVRNQFVDHEAALQVPVELCVPSMKTVLPDEEKPPPKRHPKLSGVSKHKRVAGSFAKQFDVDFEMVSKKPCTYDQLTFRGNQRNKLIFRGDGYAAWIDTSNQFDELTVSFMDPDSGKVTHLVFTGQKGMLPKTKKLTSLLEQNVELLNESVVAAGKGDSPAALAKALGIKSGFGAYYGTAKFDKSAKAQPSLMAFFHPDC